MTKRRWIEKNIAECIAASSGNVNGYVSVQERGGCHEATIEFDQNSFQVTFQFLDLLSEVFGTKKINLSHSEEISWSEHTKEGGNSRLEIYEIQFPPGLEKNE